MGAVGQAWIRAVAELGGNEGTASDVGDELEQRYSEPHRRYHTLRHVETVLVDAKRLGEALHLNNDDQATLALAVCAHDVIYEGAPGQDERASADWAKDRAASCRLPSEVGDRVAAAVLATASHTVDGPDHLVACLLDADLAILAAPAREYNDYTVSVRAEYHHLDDDMWKLGRAHVLRQLAEKADLFLTPAGRALWDSGARANLARELLMLEETS